MRGRRVLQIEDRLHTNASGDFFLMSSHNWHRLRGYPELPVHSHAHIDSYLCCIAKSAGVKQVILRRTGYFHQEHTRTDTTDKHVAAYEKWKKDCGSMLSNNKPMLFNNENWGLGNKDLLEMCY